MNIQLMTKRNTYYNSKAQSDHDAAMPRNRLKNDASGDIIRIVILFSAIAFTWAFLK